MRRRLYLTLIEMMIVVSLVVIMAGVIGINIRKAMISQRFRTEVELVVDTLRLAQDLMLVLGKDVHLRIKGSEKNKGIEYGLEVEGGAAKEWDLVLKRSHRILESTHFVDFVKTDPFPEQPGEIDLRFQSKGSMMSRGVLRFATHEDPSNPLAIRRAICLKGYPGTFESIPILQAKRGDEEWITCAEEEEEKEFFERLTQNTKEEVIEDAPPKEEKEQSAEPEEPKPQPPPQPPPPAR